MLGEEEGEETDQERAGSIDEERVMGEAASQKGGGKRMRYLLRGGGVLP